MLPGAAARCGAAGPLAVGAGMSSLSAILDTRGMATFVGWPASVHVCLAVSLLVAGAWSAQAFRQLASQDVARLRAAVSDLQTPQTSVLQPIAKDTSGSPGTPQAPVSVDAVVDVASALALRHGLVIQTLSVTQQAASATSQGKVTLEMDTTGQYSAHKTWQTGLQQGFAALALRHLRLQADQSGTGSILRAHWTWELHVHD